MSVQKLREAIVERYRNDTRGPELVRRLRQAIALPSETDAPIKDELRGLRSGFDVYRCAFRYAYANYRRLLLQLIGGAVLSNMFLLALPMFTMSLYDRVIPHQAMETLWALALGVVIALALDLALRSVKLKLNDAVGVNTSVKLQAHLYQHLLKIKMAHAPRSSGGAAQHLRDLDAFCQLLPNLVTAVTADLPFFLAIMILLYALGGPIVFAPLFGAGLLAAVYSLGQAGARRAYYEAMQFSRQQSNLLTESVHALESVKSAAAEGMLQERWEKLLDNNAYIGHKSRYWLGFAAHASATITQLTVVLVAIIGVYQVTQGEMTAGALSASILLVGRCLAPVSQAISLFSRIGHLNHVAENLVQFLNAPREERGDLAAHAPRIIFGKIDLHNASFTYPGASAPCLHRINLSVKPGERVGLIGRVGSGKSTLLRLLTRLYEPGEGSLLIDGYDSRQLDPAQLRRAFGFMRQDTILFDDTLEANIVFGGKPVSEDLFDQAVRISGVKDFASRHPQGYSLRVGTGGENLSGGERQSVALARLLLSAPRVLLLDEPSAGLDSTLEARLVRELRSYLENRTLILATHRTTLLALVERIIWLEGGRIVVDGPRDEVLQKLGAPAQTLAAG